MTCGVATDTGSQRERNEDRYWIDPDRGIFLVVDGVGGNAGGDLAAEIAVDVIRGRLEERSGSLPAEERIRAAIAGANHQIYSRAQRDPALRGMSCVLTLALVEDGEITIGHVGDSRLYLVWNGALRKLTSDHSPVGEDEDAGELSEPDAMRHPRRNEVFRDVGSRPRLANDADFIEIRHCRFHPEAALLLCSDGLTDYVHSSSVREIVGRYDGDPARVAVQLVEAANRAGGNDNVTALFVAGPEYRGQRGATRPRQSTTRYRKPAGLPTGRLAFLVYGLIIGMLLWVVLRTRG